MEGMMLHCGANLVEEQEVLAVETPPSTRTHYPVPHSLLINLIGKMLDNVGWSVVKRELLCSKMVRGYLAYGQSRMDQLMILIMDSQLVLGTAMINVSLWEWLSDRMCLSAIISVSPGLSGW